MAIPYAILETGNGKRTGSFDIAGGPMTGKLLHIMKISPG